MNFVSDCIATLWYRDLAELIHTWVMCLYVLIEISCMLNVLSSRPYGIITGCEFLSITVYRFIIFITVVT